MHTKNTGPHALVLSLPHPSISHCSHATAANTPSYSHSIFKLCGKIRMANRASWPWELGKACWACKACQCLKMVVGWGGKNSCLGAKAEGWKMNLEAEGWRERSESEDGVIMPLPPSPRSPPHLFIEPALLLIRAVSPLIWENVVKYCRRSRSLCVLLPKAF